MSIKSLLEDILFSVIQHLPIVPGFLMNWTNDYLNRRITQLQYETIRQRGIKLHWKRLYQKFTNGNRTKKSTNRKFYLSRQCLLLFIIIMIST